MNPVVHHNEHAAAHGFLARGDSDGVEEVERTVGGECRCRPHGGGQHDGLSRLDHEIEKVGRFFDGVRAVGDHDARHIGHGDERVDAIGQLEPHLVVHVLRPDVGNLLAAHVGELLGLGNGSDQLIDANLA